MEKAGVVYFKNENDVKKAFNILGEEEMLKDKAKFEEDVRTDLIEKFQKLPWYKRLWFNPKYIQK